MVFIQKCLKHLFEKSLSFSSRHTIYNENFTHGTKITNYQSAEEAGQAVQSDIALYGRMREWEDNSLTARRLGKIDIWGTVQFEG